MNKSKVNERWKIIKIIGNNEGKTLCQGPSNYKNKVNGRKRRLRFIRKDNEI